MPTIHRRPKSVVNYAAILCSVTSLYCDSSRMDAKISVSSPVAERVRTSFIKARTPVHRRSTYSWTVFRIAFVRVSALPSPSAMGVI